MCGLYLHPFLTTTVSQTVSQTKGQSPSKKNKKNAPVVAADRWWQAAVSHATWNWVVWLSCMTEVVFQLPHNWFTDYLEYYKGTFIDWPFVAYGIADSRWCYYTPLAPAVWLINYNDGALGVLCILALLFANPWPRIGGRSTSTLVLVLTVVFRDATLWRETVEYMWDHHRHGYPYTTTDPVYRPHAIAIVWLVNIIWLIAPLTTPIWAYHMIRKQTKMD